MNIDLQVIPGNLLAEYCKRVNEGLQHDFERLHDSELSIATFSFYTSVSAVFSSKIEGEDIELDSYVKHKRFGGHFLPDYTRKIDDLYEAYSFAKEHELNYEHILHAHKLLTNHILSNAQQGALRKGNMFVITKDGKIEYVAAAPAIVGDEINKLFTDIEQLLNTELNFKEVLFYAAMIHLVFVKIHPFEDGNGRTARLLEKWFLARKLGERAWFVQSERNYYEQHQAYYNKIRALGLEYDELDYSKALPFLLLLPQAIVPQE